MALSPDLTESIPETGNSHTTDNFIKTAKLQIGCPGAFIESMKIVGYLFFWFSPACPLLRKSIGAFYHPSR
jgi:hypothetical protein